MTTDSPILEMRGIRKVFPGVVALSNVDFDLLPGEVHALVGENGAGKSTLIKIISGLYQRDGGTIKVNGKEVDFKSPADAIAEHIKVVYQELDLVPTLSVAENVFLGNYPHGRYGNVDWRSLYEQTSKLLTGLGMDIDPQTPLGQLRVAEQQLVEIARALSRQAQIIVMDEPTSALSPAEVDKLFGVIERLKEARCGIIYVSHKLDEIFQVADRVTVFRDGLLIDHPAGQGDADDRSGHADGRPGAQGVLPQDRSTCGRPLARSAQCQFGTTARFQPDHSRGRGRGCVRPARRRRA